MALKNNLKGAGDEIQRLNDLGTEFSAIYKDIGQALQGLARDSKDYGSGIRDAAKLSADLARSAQELSSFTKEDLKDRKTANEFARKSEDLAKKRQRLESQIRVFRSQALNATKAEQAVLNKVNENLSNAADYTKQIGDGFDEIAEASEKIKKADPFGGFSDFIKEIPVLGRIFPEIEKASETFRDNFAESGKFANSLGKSLLTATGALSKLATLEVLRRGVEEIDNAQKRVVDFRREIGLSLEEASELQVNMSKIANDSGKAFFNSARFAEAQKDINNTMGTNATISSDMAENFSALVYRLGLSNDEATKLNLTSVTIGKSAKDLTSETKTRVKLLNGQNKIQISERAILKDISQTSARTQLSLKAQGKSLIEAVYSAKQLGLNMGQVEKIADSLLDFEQSISAELEAELLTGKSLNLDKAREFALTNDMAGLTAEIAKNVGSAEEFGRMNRIQQEAIAKAVGMTAEELAQSFAFQKQLSQLSKDSAYRDAKSFEDLKAKVALKAKDVGYEKALAEVGEGELKTQLEAATVQEQIAENQAKAADKMLEALGPSGLQGTLETLNGSIDLLTNAIIALTALQLGKTVLDVAKGSKDIFKNFRGATDAAKDLSKHTDDIVKGVNKAGKTFYKSSSTGKFVSKEVGEAALKSTAKAGEKGLAKTAAKVGTKGLGKSLLKKIPIVGALAGIGFGLQRAAEGDWLGAAGEVASGIASTIPGAGTAVSAAIDVGLAGRDIYKSTNRSSEPMEIPAEDFTIRTHPKDELVIAGGTNLSGGSNQEMIGLLQKLVSATEQSRHVTVSVDGEKVFSAMGRTPMK
jgi:hypothetical protein